MALIHFLVILNRMDEQLEVQPNCEVIIRAQGSTSGIAGLM